MTCTAATNSAPSSRYSRASEPITTISDRALLMGCFCTSRLIAPPIHTAPKMRKRARCMVLTNPVPHEHRYQKLPAKRHQLVITEAGQRTPDPDIDKDKNKHPQCKPEHGQQRLYDR